MKKQMIWMLLAALLVAGCGASKEETNGAAEPSASETKEEADEITEEALSGAVITRPSKKEESVHIKTAADGRVKDVRVEVQLLDAEKGDFKEDITDLREIKNRVSDESFLLQDGHLYFEDHGEDITYEGISDAELPFEVQIRYYLDGEEIAPEDLAGKSGEVTIRFDYENKTRQETSAGDEKLEMQVPMTALSLAVLPDEVFSDITVKNGKLINFAGQKVAVGLAMPGLKEDLALADFRMTEDVEIPEYVEITAQAEKFELDFTATIVSPGFLSEEEEDTDGESIDTLFEDMTELKDASGELLDGATEIRDGADELRKGVNSYVDGASDLADAAGALRDGLQTQAQSSSALTDGAAALSDGLAQLEEGLSSIDLSFVDSLSELPPELKALIPPELSQTAQSIAGLQEAVGGLKEGASSLKDGITAYTDATSQLSSGASGLADGATSLHASGGALQTACKKLLDGIDAWKDGAESFDEEGIQELTKLVGEDMKKVVDRLRAAQKLDDSYDSFSGILDGQEGSVRFIFESEAIS